MKFLVLLFCFSVSNIVLAQNKVISKIVGAYGDAFVSSRECEANQYLENYLSGKPDEIVLKLGDSGFERIVTGVLLERTISLEAEDFSVASLDENELTGALKKINPLFATSIWKSLDVQEVELKYWLEAKLRSKKFVSYKTDSASIPITDSEAKEYFDKNRLKFGSLPFANFKENIKQFLVKQQLETSLRDWFEVLNRKYRLRNFESQEKPI